MDPETRRTDRRDKNKRLSTRTRGSDSESEPRTSGRSSRYLSNTVNGHDEPRSRISRNEQGEIVEYRHDDGESYKVGEATYIQTQRSDVPYLLARITDIKVTKAGHAEFVTRPFHRLSDLPDQIYRKLTVDRQAECKGVAKIMEKIECINFANRELFICDAEDIQREIVTRNQMRGHCKIDYYNSLEEAARKFSMKEPIEKLAEDSFFYILGYNPQKRVISCQDKEFERVKQIHHWTAEERGMFNAAQSQFIPEATPYEAKENDSENESENEYESLTWKPGVADTDLVMYLRAARSMAAFAGMCDGGPTDACITATRDATTLNAIDILQKCGGKVDLALERLCSNPMPSIPQRMWTEEDIKAFVKGLSQYGKDFFYVAKEFLPNKETSELIEFYYLWKKTPDGLQVRQRYRRAPKRTMYNQTKSSYPRETTNTTDVDEFSDDDLNSIDSQINGQHICRNCYAAVSSDWHHGGKTNQMLCADCRLFYKKYGIDRPIDDRPETPTELRKIRELAKYQDNQNGESNNQTEIDYDLKNTDESSQPDVPIEVPVAPMPVEAFSPKPEVKAEVKPLAIKVEAKPEEEKITENEENKRKLTNQENNEPEGPPVVKKPKVEIKQEYKPEKATSVISPPQQPLEVKVEPKPIIFPNDKVKTFVSNVAQLDANQINIKKPSGAVTLNTNTTKPTPTISLIPEKVVPQAQPPPEHPTSIVHLARHTRLPPNNPQPTQEIKTEQNRPRNIPASSPVPVPNCSQIQLPKQEPTPIPSRPILGQPRQGVERGPWPEMDAEHPCGPFHLGPPSPPPIRTSKPFSANNKTARFVRNWEYQDGNSCARTDLYYRKEEEEAPPIIRRPPPSQQQQPTQPTPRQQTHQQQLQEQQQRQQQLMHQQRQADYVPRPERTRSTGSVGGGSSRPPSSGPTRGVPTRQPNAPHQRHPNSIPVSTSQFRPSMPNRPSMSPGFPSDLTNRSLLGNNLALSQASLPPHMSQQSTAELQYALHHQSQFLEQHRAQAQALQLEQHRAQAQALQLNQLASMQERERQILGGGGLNQNDLHLLHQQSRIHEDTVRRAEQASRNALISGIPQDIGFSQDIGLRHAQNSQNTMILEQQRAHAQAAQATALAAAQHEALMRNTFAGSPFTNSQLLNSQLLDPRLRDAYRTMNHQPK